VSNIFDVRRKVTLLVQDLQGLAKVLQADQRYPALEMILSRGRHFRAEAQSPDHFRFQLFGVQPEGELPIAALTRAGDGVQKPDPNQYWLRTDPVTLWADMAGVVMTGYGFADLDEFERNEIENSVRSVLLEEGIHLHADHTERWCIALGEPLDFRFTPLEEALGMDLAEAMPEQAEALHWRRIMNEIQIALHACPVNVRRRQRGQQEINSVWFWGGGFIPDASRHGAFETVYSDNPVSRGLATINDCRLKHQSELSAVDFDSDGQSVLVDWSSGSGDPYRELKLLDDLANRLLAGLHSQATELEVYCGKRNGWRFNQRSSRKFWRRISSLAVIYNHRFTE
jgi:hypothetical protein